MKDATKRTDVEVEATKIWGIGEVGNPHDFLRSPNDKLLGSIIRGDCSENYLLFIATDDAAQYYGEDESGESELIVFNPGFEEVYVSFSARDADFKRSLDNLRNENLNDFEINELFGHDGPSSNLGNYIAKLIAKLPPDECDCCTDSDASECIISDAVKIIKNIIARYGDGKTMQVHFSDGDDFNWQKSTDKVLRSLKRLDQDQRWLMNTGDGHVNPVVRIKPIQIGDGEEYQVGVLLDYMIGFGNN